MNKYSIGAGKRDFGKEWVHVDGDTNFDHITSNDVHLLNVKPGSIDLIYSSHFIEYFDRQEVKTILEHWHFALKPGGELRVAVPDFEVITRLYHEKEYELEAFLGLLYGRMEGGKGSMIYHKTVYDFKSLCRVLAAAGFIGMVTANQVRRTDPFYYFAPEDDHSRAVLPHMSATGTPVSLNVICYK